MSTKRKIFEEAEDTDQTKTEVDQGSESKEEKKIKRRVKKIQTSNKSEKSEQDLLVLLYNAIKLSAQTLRSPDEKVSYPSRYRSSVRVGERENCWRQDRSECGKYPECVLGSTMGAVGGRERKRLRQLAGGREMNSSDSSVDQNYLCEYRGDLQPYWLGGVIEVPAYSRQYFRLVGIAESVDGVHLPALFFEDVSSKTTGTVYLTFAPMTELYERKEYPKNFQALSRYFCGRWMVAPYQGKSGIKSMDSILENVFIHGGTWEHWQSLKDGVVAVMEKIKPRHLVIGGFSLGGALAQLAAFDLFFTANLSSVSRLSICSAGAFRVGNLEWRKVWDQLLHGQMHGQMHGQILGPKIELMNLALGTWNTQDNLELDPITQIPVANIPDKILFEPLPLHTLIMGTANDLIRPDKMHILFIENKLVTIKDDSDFDICTEMFPMIKTGKLKLPAEIKSFAEQFPLVMSMIDEMTVNKRMPSFNIKINVEKMHHAFFYAEEIRKYLLDNTVISPPRDIMYEWETRNQ